MNAELGSLKSFQNCKEDEIPGYNDCPSFLFYNNKKVRAKTLGARRHHLIDNAAAPGTCRKVCLPAVIPPPQAKRNISGKVESVNAIITAKEYGFTSEEVYTKDDILEKIREFCQMDTSLSEKEFYFYKNKVDKNAESSLNAHFTRQIITHFFQLSEDKEKGANFLRKWMISDITISNWCPAFLKIFENVQN
ncbi:Add37p KNAG_0F01700 [Huiozyma naganishii CBS 8797]|uniref:Uncharacterized protein n=1 Tax=Huiozyma naganishii (strain ATCC MYA-139 / BCRC 22969 / CBS 8797 / KCTC 17520 / NBRC 10181 / NCYC 3082 / Yp74L-3) TaxID=1071383 RepID=J7RMN9_HUIN7|nr:hypothetical protein KNAG_0F01700 [Kazachstania naganishii CBS 8797]CCK70838.1 hypothetical protein KNAG_0F01700 [Kazachstania naganishii CBS 8797]